MGNLKGFDANTVEPKTAFEPIPAGDYHAMVTDSEMKTTQSGTGEYLSLTFEILDGEFKGRKLFANLNLDNPNGKAVEIARAELSAICRSVGKMQVDDSSELHNIPMVIKVGIEKRKDTLELQNRIKGYKPRGDANPGPAVTTPPGGGDKPKPSPAWQRKTTAAV